MPTKKRTKSKPRRKFIKRRWATSVARKPENKHFDVNISQSSATTGTLTLLSAVGQGVDDTQRVGNTLYLRTLFLVTQIGLNLAATSQSIRLIILIDKQGYNAPSVGDVIEPALLGGGLAPISQYNHYYMSRFKILYDKTLKVSTGYGENLIWKRTIPLRVNSHYIGTSTTFKNQIYILHFSNETNNLQLPLLNASARIIYNDS